MPAEATTIKRKNHSAFAHQPRNESEARAHLEKMLGRMDQYSDPAVWIERLSRERVLEQLEQSVARRKAGIDQPLFGLTFAIKDNFDFAGASTTAACPAFSYLAKSSATVVDRLCSAGAIAMGKTNLDQFATGLVGVRSPYGAVKNPFDADYISGGSSSGSAVAVAAGLVDFSLGTDTAGSGRVPAAFCNLVGYKPTRGYLSTVGIVPACRSLDCPSIFAHTCQEAAKILKVVEAIDPADPFGREDRLPAEPVVTIDGFRFGVPSDEQLKFFGNAEAKEAYRRAIHQATEIGGQPVTINFQPFVETARLLYEGPWVAERYLACKDLFDNHPESLLPVTRAIIAKASGFTAADAFSYQYQLMELRLRVRPEWAKMDALLLPTTGTIYTRAEVLADPIQLNSNLGYYTNFVNLLDLSAVAVPNGFQANGLPLGVTFMAPANYDHWLLDLGQRFGQTREGK